MELTLFTRAITTSPPQSVKHAAAAAMAIINYSCAVAFARERSPLVTGEKKQSYVTRGHRT